MAVETRQSRNGQASPKGKEGGGPAAGSKALNGQEEKKMNRTFYIVFLSLIIDLLAFTVILPLLPSLLDHYGHKDKHGLYAFMTNSVSSFRQFVGAPDTPKWNSVLFGGVIGSLFSFLQFLSTPFIGAASDVYGRRPLMLLCMVGVASSYVLWMLSDNFTLFVIARIIGGVSKGNVSLSTAIVTDVSTPEKRGKGMALVGVAFSIGFVFGPSIGAMFSFMDKDSERFYVLPAIFCIVLALADILFLYVFLPETLPEKIRSKTSSSVLSKAWELISPVSLFQFASVKLNSPADKNAIQSLGWVYFLYLYVYSGMEFTLPFLMFHRFDYNSMQQGKMFFFIGTIMALVQGGYVRRVKRGKEIKVVTQGILVLIPSFVMMAFAKNIYLMYTALALFSFASATVVPCLTTQVSVYGGSDQKGVVMGIFRSLGSLARATSPVFAATVYWCFGAETCYVAGGVFMALPLLLTMKQRKEKL
ncbi:major facilitator superfamily domain-containing protein 10-like [Littorina saxatilis]|uniref:Major facilitator superfamily (MFS) profile domain-containing protein n=1 Tax=Littorina saxatilis TaxID=31220 RepID=A0AAN9BQU6_9CAEN